MSRLFRPLFHFAVCGLALTYTACSSDNKVTIDGNSNNKGKIEGKWKRTQSFHEDVASKAAEPAFDAIGLYFYLEFKPGDILDMGEAGDKPEAIKFLKMLQESGAPGLKFIAKYRLHRGDDVEVFELDKGVQNMGLFGKKDRVRVEIKIDGDTMTVTNDEGKNSSFIRIN